MLGRSLSELILIRLCIFAFVSIAPVGILYTLAARFLPASYRLPFAVEAWLAAEALFYLLFYLPRKYAVQRPAIHPPLPPRLERQKLFAKCHTSALIADPVRYLSLWFHNAPASSVRRENAKQFISWAFFNGCAPSCAEDEEELESYVDGFEEVLGWKLEEGYSKDVRCLRLTLDPVQMRSKPLVMYAVIFGVDMVSSARLWMSGFGFFPTKSWKGIFPPRIQSLLRAGWSPARGVSYWYRPHRSRTKLPMVFIHGIGIGLHPYVSFLVEAAAADEDVGVLAIEVTPITFHVSSDTINSRDFCVQIEQILSRHGIDKFVLIAHSYGTILSTYLLHSSVVSPRIASLFLIDPVCFLLHLPNVAYNFCHRVPTTANEWQLWYFASRDIGIAHTLARYFFWAENILWKEELPVRESLKSDPDLQLDREMEQVREQESGQRGDREGKTLEGIEERVKERKWAVVISGSDLIVDTDSTWRYLTDTAPPPPSPSSSKASAEPTLWTDSRGDGAEQVLWFPNIDHAQVFDTPARRRPLLEIVSEFVKHDGYDEEELVNEDN